MGQVSGTWGSVRKTEQLVVIRAATEPHRQNNKKKLKKVCEGSGGVGHCNSGWSLGLEMLLMCTVDMSPMGEWMGKGTQGYFYKVLTTILKSLFSLVGPTNGVY